MTQDGRRLKWMLLWFPFVAVAGAFVVGLAFTAVFGGRVGGSVLIAGLLSGVVYWFKIAAMVWRSRR